jgi:hypothetical protein
MTPRLAGVPAGMLRLVLSLVLLAALPAGAAEPPRQEIETVERLRERKFKAPVVQKTIRREELRKYLTDQFARELPVPLEDYLRVLDALELIENREGMSDSLLKLFESQVLAFYDPATDVYYALDKPPAGFEFNEILSAALAIHELTHALQDQHFRAGDRLLAMKGKADAQMAYQAVLEGEAMLVMAASLFEQFGQDLDDMVGNDAFLASLSMMAELNPGVPAGTPAYFVESLKFPYLAGLRLVLMAYRRGGWEGVDALHKNPPASTEQVLHAEKFFTKAAEVVPADVPPQKSKNLMSDTMGEFGWRFLLGEEAASGWGGDSVQVREGPAGVLSVSIETIWDTQEDARQFAAAYEQLLKSRRRTPTLQRDGRRVSVRYTAN